MNQSKRGRRTAGASRANFAVLKRLVGLLFSAYPFHLALVIMCIFLGVFANVQGNLFIQTLIDSYILPLTRQVSAGQGADFGPLLGAMLRVAAFYAVGIGAVLKRTAQMEVEHTV